MKKIYFITGASGVGKTTLVKALKEKYRNEKNWHFIHFDSFGIPSVENMIKEFGSCENWQKEKIYFWINKMINDYNDKDHIFFDCQSNIQFIIDGFLKNNFENYKIILIDCNEEKMISRIIKDRNQPELINENMKNWLKFLRNQANELGICKIDTSNLTIDLLVDTFEKNL